jgi:hypothetical protein
MGFSIESADHLNVASCVFQLNDNELANARLIAADPELQDELTKAQAIIDPLWAMLMMADMADAENRLCLGEKKRHAVFFKVACQRGRSNPVSNRI